LSAAKPRVGGGKGVAHSVSHPALAPGPGSGYRWSQPASLNLFPGASPVTRTLLAACLFAAAAFACLAAGTSAQQPPAKKQPKGKYDPPAAKKPDAATLKLIREKTEQLRKAVDGLKAKKLPDDVLIEVEIYLKAAENIVRFEEWYHANSGKWALTTLDQGLERAKQARRYEPRQFPHMNLARIRMKQGRWWDALREFEQAVRLAPGDADLRRALHSLRARLN